jgi:3-phosphoshikimate 1-carboxyvinyltransferase
VHRLSVKESNRALALQDMLANIGIHSKIVDDALQISGGHFSGGRVESHNDHRIAMAAAIAGLAAANPVAIEGAECVAKSWPGFFEDLQSISSAPNLVPELK